MERLDGFELIQQSCTTSNAALAAIDSLIADMKKHPLRYIAF